LEAQQLNKEIKISSYMLPVAIFALVVIAIWATGKISQQSNDNPKPNPTPTPVLDSIAQGQTLDRLGLVSEEITPTMVDAARQRGIKADDIYMFPKDKYWEPDDVVVLVRARYANENKLIPETIWNQNLVEEVLIERSDFFSKLPQSWQTKKNFLFAVQHRFSGFDFREIVAEAITQESFELLFRNEIDHEQTTAPSCAKCVLDVARSNPILHSLFTEKFILEAVRIDGTYLEYIPRDKKTWRVCLEAMKQSDDALRYVPPYLIATHGGALLQKKTTLDP
jgi:hypothetical protein